ncbi:MAG: pyroglutamyl-peptidase I [Eubacteriaceae bacterium]|nr:pyroglutamyl-peptidase I [Eubacteriaceae bacterium]
MKRILVTCFEPFGGENTNSSMTATQDLSAPEGWEMHRVVLPVLFSVAASRVMEEAGRLRPDVILLTGQAGSRSYVSVEAMARNVRNAAIPDNGGYMPVNEKIAVNGAEACATGIDAEELVERMRKRGINARLSTDAGSFVCNDVYYSVLKYLRGTGADIVFIHLPYVLEEAQHPSGMSLERQQAALGIAVNFLTGEERK